MIKQIDVRTYKFCKKMHKRSRLVDHVFIFGAAKVIYILGAIAAVLTYQFGGAEELLGLILRALVGLGISALIGLYVRRKRPTKSHLGKPLIKLLPFEYWKSFPSDHAMLTTLFLLASLPFVPLNIASVLIFLWFWVIASRVYVGVHYVSDVTAGALLGLLVQLMIGTIGL